MHNTITEVGHAYLCFERRAPGDQHVAYVERLVDDGILYPDAAAEHVAAVPNDPLRAENDWVDLDCVCPAGKLLPRGARVFAWIDSGSVRYLEGFEERAEKLAGMLTRH